MQLSPANLELIRTQPQQTRLYLSIFQPQIVMQCLVNNGAIAKGAMTIAYDTVTFGAWTDVAAGMTMLIGTTLGGHEVGRIRVRSAGASSFSVSENSNINWQDNLYLTILKYWEVWPVFPRIIHDPANIENVIFYKDYDIAYTNQNSLLGSLVCAGPHRAAHLDGGIAQQYFTAAGTENLLAHAMTYAWEFEGGTPATYAGITPGYVSWNATGHYVVKLTVTDSVNGAVDITYRYVSIYNKFGEGTSSPIKRWELSDFTGSRGEGGYSATLSIYDDITVDDNAVVVIFAEDWYGNTKQSLGGNATNASDIVFVGYIEKDTIQYDYRKKLIQFSVTSITGLMKNTVGFSVSAQNDPSPNTWYKILGLDVRRSIYHYLRWHTTVMSVADVQFVGQDRGLQYFDADRTSLYDAIDNLMRGTLIGSTVSDRQSKIWTEINAQAYPNPTGTFTPVMDITKRDWRNEPSIQERLADEMSYIEYGGIYYNGGMPLNDPASFSAFLSCAPGNAPSFRGKPETLEGLAIASQSQLNQLVGNVFANKNSKYPSVTMDITENLRNLDIAPQEAVGVHVDAQDNSKGIALDILGIPTDFQWTYDHKSGLLLPTITFANLVSGVPGDTIVIPAPSDLGDGFTVPDFQIPPLPIFSFPSPSGTSTAMDYIDVYSDTLSFVSALNVRPGTGTWGLVFNDSRGLYVDIWKEGLYLLTGWIQAHVADGGDPGIYFFTDTYPPFAPGTPVWYDTGLGTAVLIGDMTTGVGNIGYPWDAMVRNHTHGVDNTPAIFASAVVFASPGHTLGIQLGNNPNKTLIEGRFQAVRLSD